MRSVAHSLPSPAPWPSRSPELERKGQGAKGPRSELARVLLVNSLQVPSTDTVSLPLYQILRTELTGFSCPTRRRRQHDHRKLLANDVTVILCT